MGFKLLKDGVRKVERERLYVRINQIKTARIIAGGFHVFWQNV